jgi:hypothetical protein
MKDSILLSIVITDVAHKPAFELAAQEDVCADCNFLQVTRATKRNLIDFVIRLFEEAGIANGPEGIKLIAGRLERGEA